MIHTPHVDWFALAPELMLLGAMGFALIGGIEVVLQCRDLVGQRRLATVGHREHAADRFQFTGKLPTS